MNLCNTKQQQKRLENPNLYNPSSFVYDCRGAQTKRRRYEEVLYEVLQNLEVRTEGGVTATQNPRNIRVSCIVFSVSIELAMAAA